MQTEFCNDGAKQSTRSAEGWNDSRRIETLTKHLALWHSVFQGADSRDLELMLVAYSKALHDLSPEQLEYGCEKVLKRAKFFPTPAEILELAGEPAVQSLELQAERAWQSLLRDFDEWASFRTSAGAPLRRGRFVPSKRPRQDCEVCDGTQWCPVEQDGVRRVKLCPCTEPREELVPELDAATLYALATLGGYAGVADEINDGKGTYLHKQFVQAYQYHRRTSALGHLPAAKSDAALLAEIEDKAGIRLLKR